MQEKATHQDFVLLPLAHLLLLPHHASTQFPQHFPDRFCSGQHPPSPASSTHLPQPQQHLSRSLSISEELKLALRRRSQPTSQGTFVSRCSGAISHNCRL